MGYTLENEYLKIEAIDFGGELKSIVSKKTGREYLWPGNPDIWKDSAPNLFPYIGRFTEGGYTYKGKKYEMNLHGIVRYVSLCAEHTDQELVFVLRDNEATHEQYPFKFVYKVHFRLEGSKLVIVYEVENTDDKTMYFGVGGHPGFNVPLEDGLAFEDYYLQFEEGIKPEHVKFSDNILILENEPYNDLKNHKLPLQHSLFDLDAVVLEHSGPGVVIKSDKGTTTLKVEYPDMRYVGFWHKPQTTAQYVCVEPWSSLPSREGVLEDLETQANLLTLEPGGIYKNEWSVTIDEG